MKNHFREYLVKLGISWNAKTPFFIKFSQERNKFITKKVSRKCETPCPNNPTLKFNSPHPCLPPWPCLSVSPATLYRLSIYLKSKYVPLCYLCSSFFSIHALSKKYPINRFLRVPQPCILPVKGQADLPPAGQNEFEIIFPCSVGFWSGNRCGGGRGGEGGGAEQNEWNSRTIQTE